MQNPEEDILKRFLQDTFSDYEPEPSEQTWENIRTAIQPNEPRIGGGIKRFIIPVVALLLLLGSVIVWNEKSEESIDNKLVVNAKELPVSQLVSKSSGNVEPLEISKHNSSKTLRVNSVTPYVEEVDKFPIARQQSETLVITDNPIGKTEVQNEEITTQPLLVSLDEKVALTENKHHELTITEGNISSESHFLVENNAQTNIGKTKKVQAKIGRILGEKSFSELPEQVTKSSGEFTNNISENHLAINDAVIEEIRYTKPVELLKNKDFTLAKSNFTRPEISKISNAKDVKPIRRATYLSISLTPLQTYRILTVNNRGVQNLQRNGLFDAERNGFAFEVGITKSIGNTLNFRSNIAYLKMRQWAEYQISTDELLVKNTATNTNSIEQIGQRRIESKTLEMVGFKVDVQKFLRTSGRNRYFIATGTQLMYDAGNNQANVFLNASAGFQHIINRNCFLTVEPTANYLLNNINDSKSLIQSSAYNLGLKVGLNFKVQ